MVYKLRLPQELSDIHPAFHAFYLKKHLPNETLVTPLDKTEVNESLHPIKEHVGNLDKEIKRMKQSRVPIVKSVGMPSEDLKSLRNAGTK